MRRNTMIHLVCCAAVCAITAVLSAANLAAQAPLAGGFAGAWVEADGFAQKVTNGFGDWSGGYARVVLPYERNTWFADALALKAFGERGFQVGVTQRHDWNSRVFQMVGASAGSGAAILPRGRVDAALGVRFGEQRRVQATGGISYVKSVTELYDVAGTASLAWYAPHNLLLEAGLRYNSSRPGDIQSHRISGVTIWTPSARRSFSVRAIAGTEGYQIIRTGTTLTQFHSKEIALAWREKIAGPWALSVQGDWYNNPSYTRSGVTIGVARYW